MEIDIDRYIEDKIRLQTYTNDVMNNFSLAGDTLDILHVAIS